MSKRKMKMGSSGFVFFEGGDPEKLAEEGYRWQWIPYYPYLGKAQKEFFESGDKRDYTMKLGGMGTGSKVHLANIPNLMKNIEEVKKRVDGNGDSEEVPEDDRDPGSEH